MFHQSLPVGVRYRQIRSTVKQCSRPFSTFSNMSSRFAARVTVLSLFALISSTARAQDITVRSAAGTERTISAAEFKALPHATLKTKDHGTPATFEGVELGALLTFAGAGPVDSLRGPMLRRVLLAIGADGYGAAVALAEIDVAIGARHVLVADRMNGAPLSAEHGPLRLVIDGDLRGARWVRQLARLEIVSLP